MATGVPHSLWVRGREKLIRDLGEVLDALLQFTGATAGWVGLTGPDGGPVFPVRRGDVPEIWLALQEGRGPRDVRGVQVGEIGPTLLNDLSGWPELGQPPLRNLLYCQLLQEGEAVGQIVLANKPHGFTSQDAPVLLGFAYWVGRYLTRLARADAVALPALLQLALDRLNEGVLVIDEQGALVHANPAWLRWSGFERDDLLGRLAPYPFWISYRQMASIGGQVPKQKPEAKRSGEGRSPAATPVAPNHAPSHFGPFPFRRKDDRLFWCEVETCLDDSTGRQLTVAFLRKCAATGGVPDSTLGDTVTLRLLAEGLPFAVVLTDRHGRVVWGSAACEQALVAFGPADLAQEPFTGRLLRERFTTASAATLERLIRDPDLSERGQLGSLIVQHLDRGGQTQDLTAHWLAVALPDGPGFLFAFVQDGDDFPLSPVALGGSRRSALRPTPEWLSLLVRPGGEIEFWDEHWARLTGLTSQEPRGMKSEWVVDQLFSEERDRNWVGDVLNHPSRRSSQAVLRIGNQSAGRSYLCTFLPVPYRGQDCWVLLVGEPELYAGAGNSGMRFLQPLARGLSQLLNSYLTVPLGLAEMAQERTDLPAEIASWFDQILVSCQRAGQLVASLQYLAVESPGETQVVALSGLVREFLKERQAKMPERAYELVVELPAEELFVQVNRQMMKVVFRHLLTNAEHALVNSSQRRIEIRVSAAEDQTVLCEFEDTGEGLASIDWTAAFLPFYSTKGAFAKDPAHANLEAAGLGLTVSRHFLTLHGGRLELHGTPGEGTTATMILPRAAVPTVRPAGDKAEPESLRADVPTNAPRIVEE